jgi:hypothetical protein
MNFTFHSMCFEIAWVRFIWAPYYQFVIVTDIRIEALPRVRSASHNDLTQCRMV